jgi:hypothetical protein
MPIPNQGDAYMEKLWSRKEVCSELGISMRTLCRKLNELDIQCINEVLTNGVVSMKITHEDFKRIAATCSSSKNNSSEGATTSEVNDLVLISNLKTELVRIRAEHESSQAVLKEKDRLIEILQEDKRTIQEEKARIEQMNSRLLDELAKANAQLNTSLWQRLFSRGKRP